MVRGGEPPAPTSSGDGGSRWTQRCQVTALQSGRQPPAHGKRSRGPSRRLLGGSAVKVRKITNRGSWGDAEWAAVKWAPGEPGSPGRSPSRSHSRMEHPWRDALCRVHYGGGHDGAWPSRWGNAGRTRHGGRALLEPGLRDRCFGARSERSAPGSAAFPEGQRPPHATRPARRRIVSCKL